MAKVLNANVFVDDHWYGPDYGPPPDDVAEQIGAHLWGEAEPPATGVEGSTVDDGPKPLDKQTKDELVATAAEHNVDVDPKAKKDDILEALKAAGVEG